MPTSLHNDKNDEVETIIITSPIKLYGMNENIINDKQLICAEQEKRDKEQSDDQIKNQTFNEDYNYILESEYNRLNKTAQELVTKAGFQIIGNADARENRNRTLNDKIDSILENSISFRILFIIFSVLTVLSLAYFIIN